MAIGSVSLSACVTIIRNGNGMILLQFVTLKVLEIVRSWREL